MSFPSAVALALLPFLVVLLPGCGGGGSAPSGNIQPPPVDPTPPPPVDPIPPEMLPEIPARHPVQALQAPVIDLDGTLHVGAGVAPPDQLAAGVDYNGVPVLSGRVRDRVGADRVLEYLAKHMDPEYSGVEGLSSHAAGPVVHLAEGTSETFAEFTVGAVQLVNAALPYDKRIRFSTEAVTPLTAIDDVPKGHIYVDFASWADWNAPTKPPQGEAAAVAESQTSTTLDDRVLARLGSHIWVDTDAILEAFVLNPDTGDWEMTVLESYVDDSDTIIKLFSRDAVMHTLVHELLHTLGFTAHVGAERFMESVLNDGSTQVRRVQRSGLRVTINEHVHIPGHILFQVDRDGLLAAYSRFEPGALPEDLTVENLGPWSGTSFHVRGGLEFTGGEASFGVAFGNGFPQPWAAGPTPWSNLADNTALSETVTWNGALLGMTEAAQAVAGGARMAVQLATLDGTLDFTALEHWEPDQAPQAVGSGTQWGDGDLRYDIGVRGNSFVQTGGDDGEVTGVFLGSAHQAMAGVLERSDLAAGFGGTR